MKSHYILKLAINYCTIWLTEFPRPIEQYMHRIFRRSLCRIAPSMWLAFPCWPLYSHLRAGHFGAARNLYFVLWHGPTEWKRRIFASCLHFKFPNSPRWTFYFQTQATLYTIQLNLLSRLYQLGNVFARSVIHGAVSKVVHWNWKREGERERERERGREKRGGGGETWGDCLCVWGRVHCTVVV